MSKQIPVHWLIPGRILYSPGTIDLSLILNRARLSLHMIETEGQPPMIHTLIDHTNQYTPEEIKQQPLKLTYYMQLVDDEVREQLLAHPRLGWTISIATPNIGMKTAGAVISQRKNYRWHSVATLADALYFIQQRDTTLPDLVNLPLDEVKIPNWPYGSSAG